MYRLKILSEISKVSFHEGLQYLQILIYQSQVFVRQRLMAPHQRIDHIIDDRYWKLIIVILEINIKNYSDWYFDLC